MRNLTIFHAVFVIFSFASNGGAISPSNGPCKTSNDCDGQLICIGGKCNDDPDVGTHVCSGNPSPSGSFKPSAGTLTSKGSKLNPIHKCDPPETYPTPAKLTLNDFSEGGDGGFPSECDDNRYHSNSERVAALSTGWFARKSRCGKMINITANNGKSTTAKVVDECDSMHGCDAKHAYQRPCDNNVVDGSAAVWKALGLNQELGVVPITWSVA